MNLRETSLQIKKKQQKKKLPKAGLIPVIDVTEGVPELLRLVIGGHAELAVTHTIPEHNDLVLSSRLIDSIKCYLILTGHLLFTAWNFLMAFTKAIFRLSMISCPGFWKQVELNHRDMVEFVELTTPAMLLPLLEMSWYTST